MYINSLHQNLSQQLTQVYHLVFIHTQTSARLANGIVSLLFGFCCQYPFINYLYCQQHKSTQFLAPKSKLATKVHMYPIQQYLYIDICSFGKWNCLVIVWEHMVDPQHTKPLFSLCFGPFHHHQAAGIYYSLYTKHSAQLLGLAAAFFFKLGNFLLFCRRRAPSAASPPRHLSVLRRLLLVNHTLKIGGEIMADAPTNLMAKYILCTRVIWRLQQSVSQYIYDGNFWNT